LLVTFHCRGVGRSRRWQLRAGHRSALVSRSSLSLACVLSRAPGLFIGGESASQAPLVSVTSPPPPLVCRQSSIVRLEFRLQAGKTGYSRDSNLSIEAGWTTSPERQRRALPARRWRSGLVSSVTNTYHAL